MSDDWLPPSLSSRAFTVAQARALAVPASRLRSPRLHIPTRAVRSVSAPRGVEARARAFLEALPGDVAFSHVTAAQIWRLALPPPLEAAEVLHVMRESAANRIRRGGCRGHRGLESRTTQSLRGLPVTGLADTWVDLGEVDDPTLRLDDLVVIGDEIASRLAGPPEAGHDHPDWAQGPRALRSTLLARIRPRGKRLLADALGLVRAPVRSPMETRARLMFVRAGFPEPDVNADVHGRDGQWILEGDLVWREARVVGEYQGRDHASIRRRSRDEARRAVAEDEGWQVLEIYAEDVFRPPRRVACLRRFARAMELDPARLRIC